MFIDGQPLISRATVTSGRILSSAALVTILAKAYEIEPDIITILGVDLAADKLTGPVICAFSFGIVGHLINWSGDFLSFRVWNNGAKVQGPSTFGGGKGNNPLIREISAIKVHLNSAASEVKACPEILTTDKRHKDLKLITESLQDAVVELRRLQQGVARLSSYAKLVLYGWYLGAPVGAAALGIVLLTLEHVPSP